jgi:OPA family glycerol-3-phosphate transporter-like MFS transporter
MSDAPQAPASWRARIFGLTWLSYFSYYFARSNFSVVKKSIEDVGLGTKADFALVDTLYLTAYSVGQFVWGFTADTISPRKLIGAGMLATAALALWAGLSGTLGVILIAFGLNGLTQSTGWPGNARVTASWFGTQERGIVLGFWGTCYQVGPLAGTAFAGWLLGAFGWEAAFIGPAIWVAVVGVALVLLVRDKPSDVGFRDPDAPPPVDRAAARLRRRAAWKAMVRHPGIWFLGANYFCTKFIRYALLFWFPYYLATQMDMSGPTAAYMSMSFTIGGVLGVVAAGLVADLLFRKRRVAVAAGSMALLAVGLYVYQLVGASSLVANFASMMFVGAALFGADSLVSGVASQDAGGPDAAAAACGFVNGLGSIGAIAQSFAIVYVSDNYGWEAVFYMFIAFAVLAVFTLLPMWRVRPAD